MKNNEHLQLFTKIYGTGEVPEVLQRGAENFFWKQKRMPRFA
jgi:hypothetical protein